MNKSPNSSRETSLPVVKTYTFRKMVSMLESLIALDFRGTGIGVLADYDTLSADVHISLNPYKRCILTFQVTADGSLMILGNGHTDRLSNLNVPEISRHLEKFITENAGSIN